MILLIDNYDSFAHNLARYFRRLGQTVEVARNDALDVAAVRRRAPQAVVLSPGPCTPTEAGCSLEVVRQLHNQVPMLGICLGHQTIAAALGGKIVRAQTPMHGRTSAIANQQTGLFADLPQTFTVCRYHSLAVDAVTLPPALQVTATSADGTIMALGHRQHPVFGLQFHPEAILTEHGFVILKNFLSIAGLRSSALPLSNKELRPPSLSLPLLPRQPVTF